MFNQTWFSSNRFPHYPAKSKNEQQKKRETGVRQKYVSKCVHNINNWVQTDVATSNVDIWHMAKMFTDYIKSYVQMIGLKLYKQNQEI